MKNPREYKRLSDVERSHYGQLAGAGDPIAEFVAYAVHAGLSPNARQSDSLRVADDTPADSILDLGGSRKTEKHEH